MIHYLTVPSYAVSLLRLLLVYACFSSSLSLDCKPLAKTITVDPSGAGDYKTVQAAIDTIPANNDQWTKVHVRAGTYLEKVRILPDKGCIILEGEGRETTIISWNDHTSTSQSYTFEIKSENFVAKHISFVNSYNLKSELELHRDGYRTDDAVGSVVQAVAAVVGGDKYAFHQCGFLGYQDTLWDQAGRHYFNECYIEGAVDFIFGSGQSFYEKCDINVTGYGYITAQGRSTPDETNGYVFEECSVVGTGPTYLGRAYGAYSRVTYHSCTIDVDVVPKGWDAWFQAGKEDNLEYVESNCKGAHHNTSQRVKWLKNLDESQLGEFTRDKFINQDGWIEKQPN